MNTTPVWPVYQLDTLAIERGWLIRATTRTPTFDPDDPDRLTGHRVLYAQGRTLRGDDEAAVTLAQEAVVRELHRQATGTLPPT